jgi:bisphosphoglycerate-independent phosphoglycerate mutase (AlkP superfamily)
MGGVAAETFEDNRKKWSGDHIVDPSLVPGVLFLDRPFHGTSARLEDLAPTILGALGVTKGLAMEGSTLLP